MTDRIGTIREDAELIPPYDLDAERAVLGAMLVSKPALAYALSTVKRDDFYSETFRFCFDGIREAAREHESIDHIVVQPYVSSVPEARKVLFNIVEGVPTAANVARYAATVVTAARARRTLDAAERIKQKVFSWDYHDAPEYAIAEIQRVAVETFDEGAGTVDSVRDEIAARRRARKENQGITGIRTGIGRVDNYTAGLNKRTSYIIAARPNVGKSLVLGQIALNAARQGYRVFVATPEMSKVQYIERMMCAVASVDFRRARKGNTTAAEDKRLDDAFEELCRLPLYFDDSGEQKPDHIRASVMRFEPDLLIVDYLQYCKPNEGDESNNRAHEVGAISRELTRIKKVFDIPVVMAAQLNRNLELKKGQRPELHHLRDSGEIEQDADMVIFLHRPQDEATDNGEDESEELDDDQIAIEFICRKHRDGELWNSTEWLNKRAMWLGPLPDDPKF